MINEIYNKQMFHYYLFSVLMFHEIFLSEFFFLLLRKRLNLGHMIVIPLPETIYIVG